MKSRTPLRRTLISAALTGVLSLLGGCGLDPPPASGTSTAATASPAVEGLKPRLDPSLQMATANSATVECNIETIGGAALEGVHPKLEAGKVVGIAGWYADSSRPSAADAAGDAVPAASATGLGATEPATPATAENDTGVAASSASDAAMPTTAEAVAPASGTAERALQLVVASENGSQHWVVAVPARTERPDVAAALSNPAALNSGFSFELNLSELAPGFYSLHLSDTAHSAASVCGLGRGFVVE